MILLFSFGKYKVHFMQLFVFLFVAGMYQEDCRKKSVWEKLYQWESIKSVWRKSVSRIECIKNRVYEEECAKSEEELEEEKKCIRRTYQERMD